MDNGHTQMLSKISKLLLFYIKFLVAFLNSLGFRNKLQNQFFAYSNVKKWSLKKVFNKDWRKCACFIPFGHKWVFPIMKRLKNRKFETYWVLTHPNSYVKILITQSWMFIIRLLVNIWSNNKCYRSFDIHYTLLLNKCKY